MAKQTHKQVIIRKLFIFTEVCTYVDLPVATRSIDSCVQIITNFFIAQVYAQIQREHQISPGDFPNLQRMKEQLQHHYFTKFNPIKPKLLDTVDKMLAQDIAKLMIMIPQVSL